MLVAFCDQLAGNSTSCCSNATWSPWPMRASRSSHSTVSKGWTPSRREEAVHGECFPGDACLVDRCVWCGVHRAFLLCGAASDACSTRFKFGRVEHPFEPRGGRNRAASIPLFYEESSGIPGLEAERPSRAQSLNLAQVAEARKPPSAREWRSESIHRGSKARRLAMAQAAVARAAGRRARAGRGRRGEARPRGARGMAARRTRLQAGAAAESATTRQLASAQARRAVRLPGGGRREERVAHGIHANGRRGRPPAGPRARRGRCGAAPQAAGRRRGRGSAAARRAASCS